MSAESGRCKYCGGMNGEHCIDCVRPRELAAPAGSEDWTKGYAQGHQEGYERGMAAALPLPTDIIAVRVPCPLTFMLAIMKAFGRKYPKGRMRQVGEWTHFTNEEVPQNTKVAHDEGAKES